MAHWRTIAPPADQAKVMWIVLRHEIDYRQAARLGDAIVARTWVGGATRLKFERHTEILRAADRTLLAKALTIWCPIDVRTGRPTAVSPELRAIFSVESRAPGLEPPLRPVRVFVLHLAIFTQLADGRGSERSAKRRTEPRPSGSGFDGGITVASGIGKGETMRKAPWNHRGRF